MYQNMSKEELEKELLEAIKKSTQSDKELQAIRNSSKMILRHKGFTETARAIFDHCKNLIGATSGYVALLSEDGKQNEVLFLEAGGLSCDVDPELPMPVRGLRGEAYDRKTTVYHNDFMNSKWIEYMPAGHVILKNVMFAPLILAGKAVGIMGLANKAFDFNENDARLASGFGELAAIALQNSRHTDEMEKATQEKEKLICELKDALDQVKKLGGLLPICSICKKIRDDKGYWNQIEAYIRDHSEADFTHGICPECMKKYYSDFDITSS